MFLNARMYSVTPAAKAGWRAIFDWVIARASVRAELLEHEPPNLLSDMWARNDLTAAMMCGLPFALRTPQPTLLAAPVPAFPDYAGRSVYWSYLAVRADAPFRTIADTFGYVAGYTLRDSQSGYFAFRHLLITKYAQVQPYRAIVGNLINARGIVQALVERRIDVGPLDGYVFDLLRAGDPSFAAQVKILETTAPTPMPPIVATAALAPDAVARLRDAFVAVEHESSLADARAAVHVARFVVPDAASFTMLRERAELVEHARPDWP
jgi:ABC-type phosphate/phosphonate transport system substrate-binding protein